MGVLRFVLWAIHLVTFAGLFITALVNLVLKRPYTPALLHMALTMAVTGVLLVGVLEMSDKSVDNTKVAVKLLILAVILALVWFNRKREPVARGFYPAIAVLALTNAVIAFAW